MRARRVYQPPWRIDVAIGADIEAPLTVAAIARAVANALAAANAPRPGSVTVVLADDSELADLNREHMGVDGPTDVLSFPMLAPHAFAAARGADESRSRSRHRRIHIGDVAVSVQRAIEQAEQGRGGHTGDVRWSAAEELRLLVTHGVLHLCGWDHAARDEEAAMRSLERRLLGQVAC